MNIKHLITKSQIFIFLLFISLSFSVAYAQTTEIAVRFIVTPPDRVAIGEAFAVQAEVYHADANSSAVVGETITATLELLDPNGIVISTHVQTYNGFPNPPNPSGRLDNDSTSAQQVILQMPWTEASKTYWQYGLDRTQFTNDDQPWTIVVRATSPSLELFPADRTNNIITHTFVCGYSRFAPGP